MAGDALQKFKSSLNRGVATISVKASSSLEKSKLKTHMESISAEVARLTAGAGEAAYATWASGEKDYASLEATFAEIQEKLAEIDRLAEELAAIDERDSQILGAARAGESAAESGTVCPACGSRYETPVKFCRKCGHKVLPGAAARPNSP